MELDLRWHPRGALAIGEGQKEIDMTDLTLTPSPMRRISAVVMLGALGLLLIWVATRPGNTASLWLLFLIAVSAGAFYMAWRLWQASGKKLILTEEALVEEGGRVLCRLDDIAGVERGTFAFKPSNGFLIRLKTSGPRVWAPGLWWRLGKRIGVGGVTPAAQGKAMADVLSARVSGVGRID